MLREYLYEVDVYLFYIGKRYNVVDVFVVVCMSFGLIWFIFVDSTIALNFNLIGKEFYCILDFVGILV